LRVGGEHSGKWNDLPCGNGLPGYVAEFGSPLDMPTVTALDVPISTVEAVWEIESSNSFSGAVNEVIAIDDLQITGLGIEPISVKLLVSSGTLSLGTTDGLTIDGSSTDSTLY